jgi:hypothetical protein
MMTAMRSRLLRVGVLALLGILVTGCSPSRASEETEVNAPGTFMRADPLMTLEPPDAAPAEGIQIGASGSGGMSRGTLEIERVWSVDAVTVDAMATAMQLVADHDVYYSSLRCPGEYFLAGGVHRYGPYPGGVMVRLGPEGLAGSEPGPVVLKVTLVAAATAEPDGTMPSAARLWEQRSWDSERTGENCPAELLEIVEARAYPRVHGSG